MKCKLCGDRTKKFGKKVKFKNGCMCEECYNALPEVIKKNKDRVSVDEVLKIRSILTGHESLAFTKCYTFYVCEEALQINEWEIKLRDIKKIYLSFHPRAEGNRRNMVYGQLGIVIETNKPHIIMEDILWDDVLEYRIEGNIIRYTFPEAVADMVSRIQRVIDNKTYSMRELEEEMRKERERKEREEREERRRAWTDSNSYINLQLAEKLYGVEYPYTMDTIKTIRTALMKNNHPDQGGNAALCALINSSFDILKKHAAS